MRVDPAGRGRLVSAILLSLGAAGLAWLGFRAVMLAALPPDAPVVEAIAADAPERVSRLALNDLLTRRAVPDPDLNDEMMRLARQRPLDDLPLLYAGAIAADRGDRVRARRLLEEARDRAPRQRITRLLLLREYLLENDLPRAGAEMRVLVRLLPAAADLLVKALVPMVLEPKTNASTVKLLQGNRPLAELVLKQMALDGAKPSAILTLAIQTRVAVRAAGDTWRPLFVNLLIKRGNATVAYRWWQRFTGVQLPRDTIFDPDFRRTNTLAPFGWSVLTDEVGAADPLKRGGLSVDFYGRRTGTVAEQVTVLSPGRYRLGFTAEGNAAGIDSQLVWVVSCVGRNTVLLELPIREVRAGARQFAAAFTVPAKGCDGQTIKLNALAGEFPVSQTVDISGLAVRKMGNTPQ